MPVTEVMVPKTPCAATLNFITSITASERSAVEVHFPGRCPRVIPPR
jgi:hypothetical protein